MFCKLVVENGIFAENYQSRVRTPSVISKAKCKSKGLTSPRRTARDHVLTFPLYSLLKAVEHGIPRKGRGTYPPRRPYPPAPLLLRLLETKRAQARTPRCGAACSAVRAAKHGALGVLDPKVRESVASTTAASSAMVAGAARHSVGPNRAPKLPNQSDLTLKGAPMQRLFDPPLTATSPPWIDRGRPCSLGKRSRPRRVACAGRCSTHARTSQSRRPACRRGGHRKRTG